MLSFGEMKKRYRLIKRHSKKIGDFTIISIGRPKNLTKKMDQNLLLPGENYDIQIWRMGGGWANVKCYNKERYKPKKPCVQYRVRMKYPNGTVYRVKLITINYREAQAMASKLEENERTSLCLIEGRPLIGPWRLMHRGGGNRNLVFSVTLNRYVLLSSVKRGFVRL